MASSIDHLRKTRGIVRSGITWSLTHLNHLLQQPSPDAATLSSHVEYIAQREPELTALNDKIADATDDEGWSRSSKERQNIKQAYRQLLIRPEDRDALRFLWAERLPTRDNPASPIVTWRMTRIQFGASSSPFLLAATVRHRLQVCREQYTETVALLERAFYVDDLIIVVPSVETAIQVYEEARKIFSEGGMEIQKWASSSEELGHQFERDNVVIENEAGDAIMMKVLGVAWERVGDCIYLSTKDASEFATANPSTKRTVLQMFARMYDPLGSFAPFTLTAKLVFQDLWKKSRSWDERLPDDKQAR
ncbi:uncharacterized protein LOC144143379 [Haemaphysalis longicornis]